MKRVLSWLLVLVLAVTCLHPACSAAAGPYSVPVHDGGKRAVVIVPGDGEPIVDKDGNQLFRFSDLLTILSRNEDGSKSDNKALYQSLANVMKPFLLQGLLQDNWEPFYDNLETEVGKLTEGLRLNDNGDVDNGSGISAEYAAVNAYNMTHDNRDEDGNYNAQSYYFWYDWRKDPLETADDLHAYLQAVRKATGQPDIGLLGRCLGGNVIAAYLYKYGTDGLCGVGFDGSVTYGSDYISETLSGKFHLNFDAIERILVDSVDIGKMDLHPFILACMDVVEKSGVVDQLVGVTEKIFYARLVEGMTSALALSTLFAMPCYWACVRPQDYEDAKYYVFGLEGSEKREKYAGLIEKIDHYQHTVRANMDSILTSVPAAGKNIAVISKYGFQIIPIGEKTDYVADQYTSVNNSSFGATASTMFTRLPDDYIAQREKEGKGKYISPDRMVDASTCVFPDSTWFTKNVSHSNWTDTEYALLYTVVTAQKQYTVDDLATTQFMVLDNKTGEVVPMTADNCNTERWEVKEEAPGLRGKLQRVGDFLKSLANWFKALAAFLKSKLFR